MSQRYSRYLHLYLIIVVSLVLFSLLSAQEAASVAQESAVAATDQQAKIYWDDLLHYAMIGNWDMARGSGQALLDMHADPVLLLNLAEEKRYQLSYQRLALLRKDSPIKDIADAILKEVELGRFAERTDPERIAAEVKRLSSTTRGRMIAIERLKDSGEWAVPVIINALRDPSRIEEVSNIRWALPQLGKDAIHPLEVVLQQCNELNIRLIVLDSLGQIGYESALPYIKEVVDRNQSSSELKTAGLSVMRVIDRHDQYSTDSASALYEKLGDDYYNHAPSLAAPSNEDQANIWFWDDEKGLYYERVDAGAFDELMTMRCCERSVKLDSNRGTAVSLWLSAFFRMEAEGYKQPAYFGAHHADADTYALTAGPEYLHRVLSRALTNENRQVALSAIKALERNSGQQSLLYELGSRQPLIEAMSFADQEVRYSAALAIGGAIPQKAFDHSEQVVPILAEAVRQQGKRYAMVVDTDTQRGNQISGELLESKEFAEVIQDTHYTVAMEKAGGMGNIDLLVLSDDLSSPDLRQTLELIRGNHRVAFCPTVILASMKDITDLRQLSKSYRFTEIVLEKVTAADLIRMRHDILGRNQAVEFDVQLADQYAENAIRVLHRLSQVRNTVLDVKVAEPALREAIHDPRKVIQQSAIETLAQVDSLDAQRSIATLALDPQIEMPVRLFSLQQLAVSAKFYGNLLLSEQIEGLYQIVRSSEGDGEFRNMASEAFGSLNLPSSRISQLILDQMVRQ